MTIGESRRGGMTVAALWMTGAITSFSLLAVAGRAVSPTLDTFEIMLFRSGMGVRSQAAGHHHMHHHHHQNLSLLHKPNLNLNLDPLPTLL